MKIESTAAEVLARIALLANRHGTLVDVTSIRRADLPDMPASADGLALATAVVVASFDGPWAIHLHAHGGGWVAVQAVVVDGRWMGLPGTSGWLTDGSPAVSADSLLSRLDSKEPLIAATPADPAQITYARTVLVERRTHDTLDDSQAQEVAEIFRRTAFDYAAPLPPYAILPMKWQPGADRLSRVLLPLMRTAVSHRLLAERPCPGCSEPVGHEQPVCLLAVGPGRDQGEAAKHAAGYWYHAMAVVVHADCAGVPVEEIEEALKLAAERDAQETAAG